MRYVAWSFAVMFGAAWIADLTGLLAPPLSEAHRNLAWSLTIAWWAMAEVQSLKHSLKK